VSTALWFALPLLLAAQPSPRDEARTLVRRSILEYDTGQYETALADIERAYELDPLPELLYNLGQCHRALRHWREAILAFRSYLRAEPNAKNRETVKFVLQELEQRYDAEPTKPAEAAASGPPVAATAPLPSAPEAAVAVPQKRHVPAGAWWLGGSGVGVGAAGAIVFGLAEGTLAGDHTSPLPNGALQHSLSPSTFFGATTEGNVGEGLWAVGGALLVAGVVVAFTGGSK
jgi:tetratricopeptide (TPR) repeat protein